MRFYIILLIVLFFSCKKEENLPVYPDKPFIEITAIETGESADLLNNEFYYVDLYNHYTDGDANFGYIRDTSVYHDRNCLITFYKMENDTFRFFYDSSKIINPCYTSIPAPSPGKSVKYGSSITINSFNAYEGELIYKFKYYKDNSAIKYGDTLKYTIRIMDRDSVWSNISEMEKIFLPEE